MEDVRRSIHAFEKKRYERMKQRNIIGQVCSTPKPYDNVMQVGLRKVTFKWQRGNKIGMSALWLLWLWCDLILKQALMMFLCLITGEGQYGKVYTCINVDTGELMAMKEVCSSANWIQQL